MNSLEPNTGTQIFHDKSQYFNINRLCRCMFFTAALPSCRSAVKHPTSHRPRMLLAGRPGAGQASHLAPAVLHALERFTVHSLDSAVLFGVSSTCPEEACTQVSESSSVKQHLTETVLSKSAFPLNNLFLAH